MNTNPLVVILGAGRPYTGTEPSALIQTSGNRRALDWVLDAFSQALNSPEFHFVGGYRLSEIINEYPNIHFSNNEDWEHSGTLESLRSAPLPEDRPVYVCYSDIIFEADAVGALADSTSELSICVDRNWDTRYDDRSDDSLQRAEKVRLAGDAIVDISSELPLTEADAEFTGLLRLSPDSVSQLKQLWGEGSLSQADDLGTLVRLFSNVDIVDIGDRWAELETAEDIARFVLDTKANTLRRLQSMVTESVILDQYTFTVKEWKTDPSRICDAIAATFDCEAVIVRSSALAEDGWETSNAGHFESVLDVPSDDNVTLQTAIQQVVDSYHDGNGENQVLVQPMIDDVDQSGVIMTRSLDSGAPYYVINYDATTTSTDSVTDGSGEHLRTALIRKDVVDSDGNVAAVVDPSSIQYPTTLSVQPLVKAICELESLIAHDSLDIEFVIDSDETVYILQTRPMTLDPAEYTVSDSSLFETLDDACQEFTELQNRSPFVLGDRTMYGVMPDWNPAEIIGRQPRPLAASLYRYLIMNETWAKQRAEYGYRDVRPHPLMKSFAGQPYVDVRADFNSFIPETVPDELADRLIEYYLSRLENHPEYHDKVEFDILITCLAFDFDSQIEPLLAAGFTKEELEPLRSGLRNITQTAFDRYENDLTEIEQLSDRYNKIIETDLPPLQTAYYLLEDCRRLGTLPFAHLARTAFVAVTLLRSLERIGVITDEDLNAFLNSLNTVARQFEHDGYRVSIGELAWESYVKEYGHLRPGTYEITSPAYAENADAYLDPMVKTATEPENRINPHDVWDDETKREIETELTKVGFPADVAAFIDFLQDAIEGREYSKFVFSRNLSDALERLALFGSEYGLSRDELSYITIDEFFEITLDRPPADVGKWLVDHVHEGEERHAMTRAVELPPLLFSETDFSIFERPSREPNFVTGKVTTADLIELNGDQEVTSDDLDGKIVLIPQADPGYDWLFGHDIAGLITMYGGANSHMAIRAAEFSLPAAIGVGENRYEQLSRSNVIELNCSARSMRSVK